MLAHLPHACPADLDAALAAAAKGFQVWKATSAYDRAKIMRKAADLVRERYDHISKVQTQEQGKVYAESRAEVLTSADIIELKFCRNGEGLPSSWNRRSPSCAWMCGLSRSTAHD